MQRCDFHGTQTAGGWELAKPDARALGRNWAGEVSTASNVPEPRRSGT